MKTIFANPCMHFLKFLEKRNPDMDDCAILHLLKMMPNFTKNHKGNQKSHIKILITPSNRKHKRGNPAASSRAPVGPVEPHSSASPIRRRAGADRQDPAGAAALQVPASVSTSVKRAPWEHSPLFGAWGVAGIE